MNYKLTTKEEQIMGIFWEHGALFVREIVELMGDPKPHFNTVSTFVRSLEERGLVGHESMGNTYRYFATVSAEEFGGSTIGAVVEKYFDRSYLDVVSAFVRSEKIPVEELKKLIAQIEDQQ